MKQIPVEVLVETPNLIYGYSLTDFNALQLLQNMFSKKELSRLLLQALDDHTSNGIQVVASYCQYIVLVHLKLQENFNGNICFIDCMGNTEATLTTYPNFPILEWSADHKAAFVKLNNSIHKNKNNIEKAKLTTQPYLHRYPSFKSSYHSKWNGA